MTREQAFANCTTDSYVEYYAGEWVVVPYQPVTQPDFFKCTPAHRAN